MNKEDILLVNECSVVFADDVEEIRSSVEALLLNVFEKVYIAKDGKEALELYNLYKPHLIILDNIMPNMTGLEVVKHIRKTDLSTKIIILTAHKDEEYLLDAVKLFLTDYIIKPFDHSEFINLLRNIKQTLRDKNKIRFQSSFIFDKKKKILYKNLEAISLTKTELKLIDILINFIDENVEFAYLANIIWDNKELSNYINSLRNIVNKIHKKAGCDIIYSVHGYGYMIKA